MPGSSESIERLARFGYLAKGVLYATIGLLAAAGALAGRGRSTDTKGAMDTILTAPFGRLLLFAMAIGLAGYAVWRLVEGILDPENCGDDAKGLALRASYLVRGLVHASLAYSALGLATYHAQSGGGSNAKADHWTARAFGLPGGKWLVWAVAIALVVFGAYQIYRAATAKLSDKLNIGKATAESGAWIIKVSRFGIASRGVVFVAIGILFASAAKQHDPSKAGGIAQALQSLDRMNQWAFAAISLGLIAYGLYQFLNARYRRFHIA
ncbi:MAG: DUF1206 domain-containing protein [Gemmatimonadota bacterium]|nr:DUF1206 domain-containing protein [Gemmatimonadota bacterium]